MYYLLREHPLLLFGVHNSGYVPDTSEVQHDSKARNEATKMTH